MSNQDIIKTLEVLASLLELHGENEFKIRSYQTAAFHLEKIPEPLESMSLETMQKLPGIGKAIAEKIHGLNTQGTFKLWDELHEKTPVGIIEMLSVPGLGAKKIKVLWDELGIEDVEQLLQACENDQIAKVKGFGAKTQENIKNSLLFKKGNADKMLLHHAEKLASSLAQYLEKNTITQKFVLSGQLLRAVEIIDQVQFVVELHDLERQFVYLDDCLILQKDQQSMGLFVWRGHFLDTGLKVELRFVTAADFEKESFVLSADQKHLSFAADTKNNILQLAIQEQEFENDVSFYKKIGLPFIPPFLREGLVEIEYLTDKKEIPAVIEVKDLKGILHTHSTYSDGKNTLAQMAAACQSLGYQYLGITDHSKAAFYANGLQEYMVLKQHEEIDQLNATYKDFKILKGIEADILSDGLLDYGNEFLSKFDFVIASVHSALNMNINKATDRLLKAIENPMINILGHPTGRVLLRRDGYPIDHEKVIDACSQAGVCIEINASPYRLDLEWRWIHYALEKGVMLAICPDAHEINGLNDVKYGIQMAQKGLLTPERTLNCLPLLQIEDFFKRQREKHAIV
jgi:DNA polymerase (family X)